MLVDGGFYRRRAASLFGHKEPKARADELMEYCRRHIKHRGSRLYRIFYYDCPPSDKVIFHPLTRQHVNLAKSNDYKWMNSFHQEITKKRKLALRMGENLETQDGYQLKSHALKRLLSGKMDTSDLTERDFYLDINQKGVDMRIGLDIASLSANNYVDQIVMISGDSDFVPAAKHARRTGIDFILDPMWARISESLHEHIDGLYGPVARPPRQEEDPLHISNSQVIEHPEDDDATL
ncbi:MAG: NYN domain-containing protein [Yaniella sp.]|nr:NYN domain-containing protein [Yaniella sp.]